MFERAFSRGDMDRLREERAAADRAYNDALTRLDRAIRPLREPPGPTGGGAEQPPRPAPPADVALSRRPAGEPFWRRWVRGLVAQVVGPALERQEAFNRTLSEYLDRLAVARRGERESVERLVAFIGDELGALATFQSQLVQYAQQITSYVDTKDRELAGHFNGVLGSGLDAVSEAQRALDQSFALLEASARVLKREVHRLRAERPVSADRQAAAPAAPDGAAEPATLATGIGFGAEAAEDTERVGSAYVAFEEVFRGRHVDIVERQRSYLPYFEGAQDVLDLGCGRGEFLELLREQGIAARGIDTNAEMVARCAERGLAVIHSDALSHLRSLPDASVGGLFSAQVVEHLEPRYIARLLQEMHRVLLPGGRAIVETINPASWSAFFSAYLRDVTHRQPLHPDTLEHLLRAAGFTEIDVVYGSPPPESSRLQRLPVDLALAATPTGAALCELAGAFNHNVDRLNGLLFAEQDYAAIGTRQT